MSDQDYERQLSADFERNLGKRRFKPRKGEQFDPSPGSPAESSAVRQLYDRMGALAPEEQLYPDFIKLRQQLGLDPLMAQKGVGDVPHLQEGTERFYGPGAGDRRTASTTFGKWGDRLGPNSLAVSPEDIRSGRYQPGQWIETPRGWRQVQDTSWVKPGHPNPSGTFEYWLGKGGGRRGGGRRDGSGFNVSPASRRMRGPYRDLSTPTGPLGLGTRFFETPEGEFPRATQGPSFLPSPSPTPAPAGEGQVSAGGSNIGYAPGTYTGTLGGPGDPGRGGSNNPLDYLNPFGKTTAGGAGTGVPTQKAIGTAVGTLSNFVFPGLGFLTGPLARWVTHLVQGGMSPQQAQQVARQQVAQGKAPPMPSPAAAGLPMQNPQGGGFSPTGQPARGREYWSSDFGRGPGGGANAPGGYDLAGPGGGFGTRGVGFGGNTVGNMGTAIWAGATPGNQPGGLGSFAQQALPKVFPYTHGQMLQTYMQQNPGGLYGHGWGGYNAPGAAVYDPTSVQRLGGGTFKQNQ